MAARLTLPSHHRCNTAASMTGAIASRVTQQCSRLHHSAGRPGTAPRISSPSASTQVLTNPSQSRYASPTQIDTGGFIGAGAGLIGKRHLLGPSYQARHEVPVEVVGKEEAAERAERRVAADGQPRRPAHGAIAAPSSTPTPPLVMSVPSQVTRGVAG